MTPPLMLTVFYGPFFRLVPYEIASALPATISPVIVRLRILTGQNCPNSHLLITVTGASYLAMNISEAEPLPAIHVM